MYETRGLPAIQGRMLLLIEFQHEDDPAGGTRVEVSITGHMRLDTPLLGAVAQLATTLARPTVERAVERKVRRFFGTVARVSPVGARRAGGVLGGARRAIPRFRRTRRWPPSGRSCSRTGRRPGRANAYRLLPAEALDLDPEDPEPTSP